MQDSFELAVEWLRSQQSMMLEELSALCNLNSSSDHLMGLHSVADFLEKRLQDLQVPCVRHNLPTWRWTDDYGQHQQSETGPILEWQSSNRQGHRVLLAIHYDTVYPIGHSLQSCTMLSEDRMRGPGVIDAKGGIVVLHWALLAGIRFGLLAPIRWTVLLNPDEEIGSPASSSFWKERADQFDFAMLFEPAMADGSLVDSRKGSGNFLWVVRGRSAHSGRNFAAGRNAVVAAASIAVELHALNGKRDGVTINVGKIHGGGPLNVVPDLCTVRANVRMEDAAQSEWIIEQLRLIEDRFRVSHPDFQLEFEGGITSPPKPKSEMMACWMRVAEQAANDVGQSIAWKASGGASDGNKLAALGLCNIDTFGVEGDGLHSPEEWIQCGSLARKAILTLSMLRRIACDGLPGPRPDA